jgi:hypothetical protein
MPRKFTLELCMNGSTTSYTRQGVQDNGDERGKEYVLVHYKEAGMADERGFMVTYDDPYTINCTCGLYGHVGMLCRHALKVHSERRKYETYITNAQPYR